MPAAKRQRKLRKRRGNGIAQLSLVEHALCPLNRRNSLRQNFVHRCEYQFSDRYKRRRTARVEVHCAAGLSAHDEFLLWGLLSLTLAQKQPSFDFYATPHYCLRQLGRLSNESKGGKNYADFRQTLRRLSGVRYQNDRFYDPIRREHRAVSFGLLSYSLPLDPDSSRAWRIVWDPLFFEFCQATGGYLPFDLETYRDLACGSRRLFLLLKKIFWRRPVSPVFDVASLAVNTMGLSDRLGVNTLKSKLKQCATKLLVREIIALPDRAGSTDSIFQKRRKGEYSVQFHRGSYFDKQPATTPKKSASDSAIFDPLRAIGFDGPSIARISRQYNHALVQIWADVTLAAIERKGDSFFRRSPQAFFVDNIKNAAAGRRTPPDWFYELQKQEQRENAKTAQRLREEKCRTTPSLAADAANPSNRVTFEQVAEEMLIHFRAAGQSEKDAIRNAERFAWEFGRKRGRKTG